MYVCEKEMYGNFLGTPVEMCTGTCVVGVNGVNRK